LISAGVTQGEFAFALSRISGQSSAMKRAGVLFMMLVVGAFPLWGQQPGGSKSVYIEVVEAAGNAATLDSWRSVYGSNSRTQAATRELGITVRNMSAAPGQFEIEWYFVGKPANGTRRFLYDKGSRRVSLQPGALEKFAIESKELTNYRYHSVYSGYSYKSGDKADGWILRAKVGDEVVRVKASNPQLEQLEKNKAEFAKFVADMRK
jgi:hypothetical protein